MERVGGTRGQSENDDLAEREKEATSKDTLKDVSEKEKTALPTDEPQGKPPSPDGALDENREVKDADPM